MNKKDICQSIGIPLWKPWTLLEYKTRYHNAPKDEQHFEWLMKWVQDHSNDVIFMWWQTVRSFTMWHRSFRRPSEDLDAIIKSPNSIEELHKYISDNWGHLKYLDKFWCIIWELHGSPLSFFIWDLYWIPLEDVETHTYSEIWMLTPEMLTALKLRRKNWNKWRWKDLLDIWSLLLSWENGKITFDIDKQEELATKIGSTKISDAINILLDQNWFRENERVILEKIKES